MTKPQRRYRCVAVHEAGHAVAYARLGYGIMYAKLTPDGDGETEFTKRNTSLTGLVCVLAGVYAEARYSRCHVVSCMVRRGRSDMETFDAMAKEIAPDVDRRGELVAIAEKLTRQFLRMPDVWQQVMDVADVLMRDGYIDGKHRLLR